MSKKPRYLQRLVRRLSRRRRFNAAWSKLTRRMERLACLGVEDDRMHDFFMSKANQLLRHFTKLEELGLQWSYLKPNNALSHATKEVGNG